MKMFLSELLTKIEKARYDYEKKHLGVHYIPDIDKVIKSKLATARVISHHPLHIEGYSSMDNIEYKDIEIESDGVLLYVLWGHSSEWYIKSYNSIEDAEKVVYSESGIYNMFVTFMTAVTNEYVIIYRHEL